MVLAPTTRALSKFRAELAAAQKGVLGMMHFANYDSPLLLEALGDLLSLGPHIRMMLYNSPPSLLSSGATVR